MLEGMENLTYERTDGAYPRSVFLQKKKSEIRKLLRKYFMG